MDNTSVISMLAYAVEAYTAVGPFTPEFDALCERTIEQLLHLACHMRAGKSFEQAGGGACLPNIRAVNAQGRPHLGHAIAEVLTMRFGVSHSVVVSHAIAPVLQFISCRQTQRVHAIGEMFGAKYTHHETAGMIGVKAAEAFNVYRTDVLRTPTLAISDLTALERCIPLIMENPLWQNAPRQASEDELFSLLLEVGGEM